MGEQRVAEVAVHQRPGRCRKCDRLYADRLYNLDEFIRQNMTSIKYCAAKYGVALDEAIEYARQRHAAWLAEHGYENCSLADCKIAIKPAAERSDG